MQTLYFEKISQFDRPAEPVTVSLPLAKGRLTNADELCIFDGATPLPGQNRALAHWEDGSVKWLLVHLQPDLPGNRDRALSFALGQRPPEATSRVAVQTTDEGVRVDTGVLSFLVPNKGFLPIAEVALGGARLWQASPFSGVRFAFEGGTVSTGTSPVRLELEEAGPLRAVVLIEGKHLNEAGEPYLDIYGRITAYAGKPYLEVEYQFVHREPEAELQINSIALEFTPEPTGTARLALGEGFYRTKIEEGDRLEHTLTADTLLYQANEHFIDSFYGDFWADWRDASGGLTLSVHQAHQQFPKGLEVDQSGVVCWLYPEDQPPARLLQGMAKTHRLQLHFHGPDTPLSDLSARSLQFQLPDRPPLERAYWSANNPWLETFFPDNLPKRLITFFHALHDGRPKAHGMLHFGDAPDLHYTNQGRGGGETVWVNNEYDHPHACTLFYGLSAGRRALDSALVSARHWLDVDVCHYSPDPLLDGGLKIHTAYHATGGVTPSHEWVEGMLDYYALTGRQEALRMVNGVGENILRHLARDEMRRYGAASVREGGWALRAMVGLYLGTGEDRWKREAIRLTEQFLGWYDQYGALLAPYTSHSMPRVPFMIALTANSLARYLLIADDARVRELIVTTVDDLLEHCLGPDGLLFYKELPSLRRVAPTPHALEALTHAYRLTGRRHYLETATRQFAALVARPLEGASGGKYLDPSGAVVQGRGGGRIFADKYASILLFASEAAPLGLLDWYDYPF